MLCCGALALASSLVIAVGRRAAMALIVAAGLLIDPTPWMAHATLICTG